MGDGGGFGDYGLAGKLNLQKRSLTMTRRVLFLLVCFLLVPLLAVVLVGFAKGQGANEKEEGANRTEVVKTEAYQYPAHGAAAAKEVTKFFDQTLRPALFTRDSKTIAPFYADDFTSVTERFGVGKILNKAQVLDLITFPHGAVVTKAYHDKVMLDVFGTDDNTVVMVGRSRTVRREPGGRMSYGPRLFAFIFVKQHGRWQQVALGISDIPKGCHDWTQHDICGE